MSFESGNFVGRDVSGGGSGPGPGAGGREGEPGRGRRRRQARVPAGYAVCDGVSGALILALVVFTPWAFGTTQAWSLWTADIAGSLLWPLLLAKRVIAWRGEYRPPRWGGVESEANESGQRPRRLDPGILLTAILTGAFLVLLAISFLNARADFGKQAGDLVYFEGSLSWLPHSYHRAATGLWIWHVIGMAGVFWGLRDWLLFRTAKDDWELAGDTGTTGATPSTRLAGAYLPERLRRLLWVLCINGMLLVLEGGLQRAAGVADLLFLVKPWRGRGPEAVYGPWSYRSNAGQYFNMLWPVCLGFWLCLQEAVSRVTTRRFPCLEGPQLVLLPALVALLAGSLVAGSRAAAAVTIAGGMAAVVIVLVASRREISREVRRFAAFGLVGAVAVGLVLGGDLLVRRFLQGDRQAATELEVGAQDFTVIVRLAVPASSSSTVINLVALGPFQKRETWPTRSLHASLDRAGALIVEFHGGSRNEVGWVTVPDFASKWGGKEVTLAVTRGDTVAVFVDGMEVPAKPRPPGPPIPGWRIPLFLTHMSIQNPGVREVALVDMVVGPAQLPGLATGSLKAFCAGLRRVPVSNGRAGSSAASTPNVSLWSAGLDLFSVDRSSRLAGRTEIWGNARKIALDHPIWGTGAGSFGVVYELYKRPEQVWAAFAHDDWLETRVTLGWVGLTLALGLVVALAYRGFRALRGQVPGGIPVPGVVLWLGWVGLIGCLVHARFDLPFQVHSVRLLFVILAAVLASLTGQAARARRAEKIPSVRAEL